MNRGGLPVKIGVTVWALDWRCRPMTQPTTRQDLRHQGEAMLRALFGSSVQTAGFGHLLTEAAYGGIWGRPDLDLPDRLVCAIAALGAIPRLKALRRHIAAGLD